MVNIARQKVLAIVLAGGRGSRLSPLTDERAKPAIPFLGTYRLIDFSLSNLANSGLYDVWVIEQYLPHGLNDHLAGGRPWDLDRTRGGLVVLPPFASPDQEKGEFAQGNAQALAQHAGLIADFGPDIVLVLSADHIYRYDYAEAIEAHVQRRASLTMLTTQVKKAQATRFGNVLADKKGRVKQFAYKPDQPLGTTVTAEIFVYDARILLDTLRKLDKKYVLGDYGEQLIPAFVERGDCYALPLPGYWLDVGTTEAYLQAHQDFLDGKGFVLQDEKWPFRTSGLTRPPARIEKTAHLDSSLVSGGAVVAGEVIDSVLGPDVVVEAGAVVRSSVLQEGAVVRAGSQVSRSIVDSGAVIGQGKGKAAQVGGTGARSQPTVIGAGARIGGGVRIGAGRAVAPRSRVQTGQEEEKAPLLEHDDQG